MIDVSYRGDDRQPQQEPFSAKSPEYMAAFYRYSNAPTKENLARLMSFSKTQKVNCPKCGCRMTNGQCWQGCFNEAALESQRQVNAAIRAAYDKPKFPPKPDRICTIHAPRSIFMQSCGKCACDVAILERWEIDTGRRCETCRKLNEYCDCKAQEVQKS